MSRVPASGKQDRARKDPTPTQRALGLLARREHSRKELTRKLAARGVAREEADTAVDKLAKAGWQDDARFAESLARSRAAAGYGPLRIRSELATHGLRGEQIAGALAVCETDWGESARAFVARRFTAIDLKDTKQHRKAIELLLRRGFDRASAFAAAGHAGEAAADEWGDVE